MRLFTIHLSICLLAVLLSGSARGQLVKPKVRYDYIVPLCGGCDDSTQICRVRNVPVIWAFYGTADDLIPISETERLVWRLKAYRGKVTSARLAGQGHGIG